MLKKKKEKKREPKSIKSEVKKDKLQLIPHKYKGSYETATKNYMPINWATWKKWTDF